MNHQTEYSSESGSRPPQGAREKGPAMMVPIVTLLVLVLVMMGTLRALRVSEMPQFTKKKLKEIRLEVEQLGAEVTRLEMEAMPMSQQNKEQIVSRCEKSRLQIETRLAHIKTELKQQKALLSVEEAQDMPIYKVGHLYLDRQIEDRSFMSEYVITASKGEENYEARFYYKKPNKIILPRVMIGQPGDLTFQGVRAKFHVPTLIIHPALVRRNLRYYHQQTKNSEFIEIEHTHHSGRVYAYKLKSPQVIEVPNQLKSISLSKDLTVKWQGAPIDQGEEVRLTWAKENSFSERPLGLYKTLEKAGETQFVIKADELREELDDSNLAHIHISRKKQIKINDKEAPLGEVIVYMRYYSEVVTIPVVP